MSDIADAQTANSRESRPYGFDCEYKAFPVPGRTALVQLSNPSKVLLVQVSSFKGIVASIEDCNSAEVILGFPDRLKVHNPANIYARHPQTYLKIHRDVKRQRERIARSFYVLS